MWMRWKKILWRNLSTHNLVIRNNDLRVSWWLSFAFPRWIFNTDLILRRYGIYDSVKIDLMQYADVKRHFISKGTVYVMARESRKMNACFTFEFNCAIYLDIHTYRHWNCGERLKINYTEKPGKFLSLSLFWLRLMNIHFPFYRTHLHVLTVKC